LFWKTGTKEVFAGTSGYFSKTHWGDRIERQNGREIVVKKASSLVKLTSKLQDIQWTKIVDAASHLVKRHNLDADIDMIAWDSSDFELEDGDPDLLDEADQLRDD
jgi:hypothetical protein